MDIVARAYEIAPCQFFEGVVPPARTCVGVAQLPVNALVELELVAEVPH